MTDVPDPVTASHVRTVGSVRHAMTLLRCLAAGAPLTLSALARRVGLSKPATYNLLSTLVGEQLVSRDENLRYALSWHLFEYSRAVTEAKRMTGAARRALHDLARETGGAVLVSVLDRDGVLYVDREDADILRMRADTGLRAPLHTTASGKVLLTALSTPHVDRLIESGLAAKTTATITDPRVLRRELLATRDRGYAVCWEEQEPRLSSVAVPVLRADRSVCAAVAVAFPTMRLRSISPDRLRGRLHAAATRIAGELAARSRGMSGGADSVSEQ
jgi:DNA-binding IclR family transcriptional regulator